MFLDRVTITGADDSVKANDLVDLGNEFEFVEWGILVSKTQEGNPRFPSHPWLLDLLQAALAHEMRLSLHVCGSWVRRLMVGGHDVFVDLDEVTSVFQRVQLNFHAERHPFHAEIASALLKNEMPTAEIILQMDEVNNQLLHRLREFGTPAVPLFDTSGGAGVVPGEWPRPLPGIEYHGYAGGLGPETLSVELPRIAEAAMITAEATAEAVAGEPGFVVRTRRPARIWIDMERRVRSDDDTRFDLDKVRRCLEICAPLVRA